LIIGGSGFVGKSFKDYSKKKKIKIISFSRTEKKNILNIKKLPKINNIIYCINNSKIKQSLKYFFHFKKLLQKNHKMTKIMFFSSGSIYGPRNINKRFSEDEKPNLKKINKFKGYKKKYAQEKFLLEKEFKNLGNEGFKISIIRGFTFYGKYILKNDYLISQIINSVKSKKKLIIRNKNVHRSYMHANDMCRWIIKILKKSSVKCPIYNVGSEKNVNIKNLITFLNKKYNSRILLNKDNYKKIDFYIPSTNLAKKRLKLKNTINFKDGITSLIN
tara:strand:+ start:999 stop:1820 length:822 start_codon:yes stop_codon:yes gene_type:complete